MIIADKRDFTSPKMFAKEAFEYLNEIIYPGENFYDEYTGFSLREKAYENIIKDKISGMNQKVSIYFEKFKKTYRIIKNIKDPLCEEFVIETEKEFILFLWEVTA